MTELVLSPPLWPEGLLHGFRPCAEGDAMGRHSCVGAFGRPGVPRSHLRLTLLHARADISLSLLLTHCRSLSSAEGFPGGIRTPSDNPAFCLGGAVGTCPQPGVQPKLAGWVTASQGSLLAATATVTVPVCCSGILGLGGDRGRHPSRRTRLLLCCLAFPDLGVLGSPLAASFLPLASGALPALPGEASLRSLTPGFIPR